MTVHDVRCLGFQDTAAFGLDLTHAVDRTTQRIHDATKVAIADGHGEHFAGTAHFLAFLDTSEITEDNHTDFASIKVERQALRAVLKGQQLVGHATRQTCHVRNAVTGRRDISHFLSGGVGRLVRLDEIVQRLAHRGRINGKFCHDLSFIVV